MNSLIAVKIKNLDTLQVDLPYLRPIEFNKYLDSIEELLAIASENLRCSNLQVLCEINLEDYNWFEASYEASCLITVLYDLKQSLYEYKYLSTYENCHKKIGLQNTIITKIDKVREIFNRSSKEVEGINIAPFIKEIVYN